MQALYQQCRECGLEWALHDHPDHTCVDCHAHALWRAENGRDNAYWEGVRDDDVEECLASLRASYAAVRKVRSSSALRRLEEYPEDTVFEVWMPKHAEWYRWARAWPAEAAMALARGIGYITVAGSDQ